MLIRQIRDFFVQQRPIDETGIRENAACLPIAPQLCESVTIHPIDMHCDVHISDACVADVRGKAFVELTVGQVMHLATDDQSYIAGAVRWVYDRHFVVAFSNAQRLFSSAEASSTRVDCSEPVWPPLRRQINARMRALIGRPPQVAIIRNVLSDSMLLDASPDLQTGQHITVAADNGPSIYGRIVWADSGKVQFRALHAKSLNMLIKN